MKRLKTEFNALVNRGVDRHLRLAVTGLSRSGKTAFITALVNQLLNIHAGARLPLLSAAREERLLGVKRVPQRDFGIPRFTYDEGLAQLYGQPPVWPTPTRGVSEIRLALRYRSNDSLLRHFKETSTLYLEIVDYPGEWLLDLPMLAQDYLTWSRQMTGLLQGQRAEWSARWRQLCEGLDPLAPADETRLAEIAAAAVRCGVKKIRLTGGEPLVRRGLPDLCRMLRAIPGLAELCLTTNGSLLPQLARPLRDAGVDRLNISLDTLRPDRFAAMTRLGTLQDVLAGIKAAEAAGFRNLKFDTVLIGGFNDDEIEDFVNLSREHPWEMRFIELMPMGPCAGWDRSRFLPAETVLDRMAELEPIEAQGVARRYQLPGALGTVGLISPVSHDFCADCRRIRVTADGKLKGCLHSREEIPLRGLHGQALEDAVRRGILHKPERHHLTERSSDTPRNMNQIGG